jgi:CheY-like chemotaxis protein
MLNWSILRSQIKKIFTSRNHQITIRLIMPPSLLRKGFSSLLLDFGYQLQSSHSNGKEMIASLSADDLPHIVLIDVDRQETPAVETTAWLREHHPSIQGAGIVHGRRGVKNQTYARKRCRRVYSQVGRAFSDKRYYLVRAYQRLLRAPLETPIISK